MFCPQCGTESQSTQYCRVFCANLKVIGKAVALSEAVARSDRGPLPKIKEMIKECKVDHVSDEVSGALDQMNQEIARISPESARQEIRRPFIEFRKRKTPAEKREDHISKGVVSLFSGAGLTVFLYYLSAALVLKLPPHIIDQIPFEIDPVVKIIWLLGLLPATSGIGHIIAGLLIPEQVTTDDAELSPDFSVSSVVKNPSNWCGQLVPGTITDFPVKSVKHVYKWLRSVSNAVSRHDSERNHAIEGYH